MKKYSLVLEGGGARGAYQVGAIKALQKMGYEFDTVIGTSIGAINAAFICQGDMEKLEELWKTLSFQDLMNINNDMAEHILNADLTIEIVNEAAKKLIHAIREHGIDIKKIRKIIEKYIDEDKIRNSNIRFGLVTFCISDMKPQKLFIEDIPKGKLVDYLLATSNLPVFKRQIIDDKSYLDGGAYDNCSVEMLYDAGYRNIIAIRIFKRRNRIRNYAKLLRKKDLNLKTIIPSEELPFILDFKRETLDDLLEYGYIDMIKQLKGLDGEKYAIEKISNERIERIKDKFTPVFCVNLVKSLDIAFKVGDNIVDVAINSALSKVCVVLGLKKSKSFKKQIINIIEHFAENIGISKNKIYTLDELINLIIEKYNNKNAIKINKIAYSIIENIKEDE